MPASILPSNAVGIADYGNTPGSGINREDLSDALVLAAQTKTPLLAMAPSMPVKHTTTEWGEDSLTDPKSAQDGGSGTGSLVSGVKEGADFSASSMTTPQRLQNFVQNFRRDVLVTRDQILMNPAGIKNTYAHNERKVMQELLRAVEARFFSVLQRDGDQTGSTWGVRLMKTLDSFSASGHTGAQAANRQSVGSDGSPASLTEDNVLDILQNMADLGTPGVVLMASAPVKRKISRTFTGIGNAGYAATYPAPAPLVRQAPNPRTIVATVATYENDFETVELHWNPWVTKETEDAYRHDGTAISEDDATGDGGLGAAFTSLAGRVWIFSQGNIKQGWFDKLHSESIGKRGDSIAGIVRGGATLIVGTTKGLGVVAGVANT